MIVRTLVALAALGAASAASAQWRPGSEIMGQQVQVQTNGVLNTVYFDRGGIAQITSPSGAKIVQATWTADAGKLCLQTEETFDCYPYRAPFTAHMPVDLLSDCGVLSRWIPLSTFVAPFERG
ncbi:hypothetical protein ACUXST_000223 [Sphingomonas sp. F9_3S_D5_B_2]|jgi:hypothetical protein